MLKIHLLQRSSDILSILMKWIFFFTVKRGNIFCMLADANASTKTLKQVKKDWDSFWGIFWKVKDFLGSEKASPPPGRIYLRQFKG